MPTLIANNEDAGTLKLSTDQRSDLYGIFENLYDIAEEAGETSPEYEFDDEDQQCSAEITSGWGRDISAALEQGRVCRSVSPMANDGSLSMGLSEYLMITPTDDIYDDMDSEEQRFVVFEGDPDNKDYPWLKKLAEFFSACGGFSTKGG